MTMAIRAGFSSVDAADNSGIKDKMMKRKKVDVAVVILFLFIYSVRYWRISFSFSFDKLRISGVFKIDRVDN